MYTDVNILCAQADITMDHLDPISNKTLTRSVSMSDELFGQGS